MRRAKVNDYWRKAYTRSYSPRLDHVEYTDVLGIGSGAVSFNGGITVICGGNGVGKSTLLDSVRHSLSPMNDDLSVVGQRRMAAATVVATLNVAGETHVIRSLFSTKERTSEPGNVPVNVTWLDPAVRSVQLVRMFAEMTHLDELLDAAPAREYTKGELDIMSYCVGKRYDYCRVSEIEEFDEISPFPYFIVRTHGVEYGSEAMGYGEMALHLLLWELGRLENGSILLIEEPETYVSPRSQQAFMDALARTCAEKSIWVILTTHSPGIVTRVPLDHVRLLYRADNIVHVVEAPTQNQLDTILGISKPYSCVVLVEDRTALNFLRTLLDVFEPELLKKCDVRVVGPVQDIGSILQKFPNGNEWFRLVGVPDGDMRGQLNSHNWPIVYLPGNWAPEELLRVEVHGKASVLAGELGRTTTDVATILAETDGLNHHDWLEEVQRLTGVSHEYLMRCLVSVWLADEVNFATARDFIDEFKAGLHHVSSSN